MCSGHGQSYTVPVVTIPRCALGPRSAKAAEDAVAEAAKTVRGMRWARVAELEMELDGKKIAIEK
jgi:hypothetical protein